MEISFYGATGFVGREFCRQFGVIDEIHKVPRDWREPRRDSKQIVYAISTTHNYNVFDSATIDVETNLMVLGEVLDKWREVNPHATFNFISSWFVYGNNNALISSEDSPCKPNGFYSITKYAAEQLVRSYAETFGLKYRILRLANVLGPDDTKVSAKKNALQYLISRMMANEPIEIYGTGDFYRNYIHVTDCVRAIRLIMAKGVVSEVYNVGRYPNVKFIDALDYAYERTGSKSQTRFIPQKEFHKKVQTETFMMDCNKLYGLGFTPLYPDIKDIIDDIVEG